MLFFFENRKNKLNQVLELPPDDQLIQELSGGQQKMVSLTLAFLNLPKLLILDEPTVGSDPLLGDCIWKYLHQCCRDNITVVIVTHYIQEAASKFTNKKKYNLRILICLIIIKSN